MAALTSAVLLAIGAGLPLVVAGSPRDIDDSPGYQCTLVCLALLGAFGALVGGAPVLPAVIRMLAWGALAMVAT